MMINKGLYRHYKGSYYQVIELAKHSENDEELVVYRALYGEKGVWVRPAAMFAETVVRDGESVPRFTYLEPQTGVLEVAILNVVPGQTSAFEAAFAKAQSIISSMNGYISHSLQQCIEQQGRYILLVNWQTLNDHTVGFRGSPEYQQWKQQLHHFYDPFPTVEHYHAF